MQETVGTVQPRWKDRSSGLQLEGLCCVHLASLSVKPSMALSVNQRSYGEQATVRMLSALIGICAPQITFGLCTFLGGGLLFVLYLGCLGP